MSSSSAKASLSICTTLYQDICTNNWGKIKSLYLYVAKQRADYRQLLNDDPWQHLQAPRLDNIVTLALQQARELIHSNRPGLLSQCINRPAVTMYQFVNRPCCEAACPWPPGYSVVTLCALLGSSSALRREGQKRVCADDGYTPDFPRR